LQALIKGAIMSWNQWNQLLQKGAVVVGSFCGGMLIMAVMSQYQGLIEVQVGKDQSSLKWDGTGCELAAK
jgi:hypothetical protein